MYSHGVNVNIRYCVVLNSVCVQQCVYSYGVNVNIRYCVVQCVNSVCSTEQCVYSHGVNVNIRYCVVLNSVCIHTVLMST